ncbi:hypothetical protein HS088_TW16G00594 [Tripterygium wilfordii]|uniref:Uncharacterized protein n=1 Tax=Tripterygium wilfordii TaxID=458696 RepID=A0A7J7CJH0_TRIWF|nr:transcription factor PRE4-like [Tripterygium wilfordii]KAF5734151.1 hypothetical protein HS088_TW16G00594 [Tripterygium wilfordii]
MSSRRSGAPRLTDVDDVSNLIMKLQALLPQLNQNNPTSVVTASSVMKEACSCIKRLQKEVDDLSETLSQLLDSVDITSVDAEFLRGILLQ